MKNYQQILVVFFILLLQREIFCAELTWEEISRGNRNIKVVLANPDNPKIVYFGSEQGIFRTRDAGLTWENVLLLRGENRRVNFIYFAPDNSSLIYAATGSGLFSSSAQGTNWRRIFKGKGDAENGANTIAIAGSTVYLGTKAGLFISNDKAKTWIKSCGVLGKSPILAIDYFKLSPQIVYAASTSGIYKTNDEGNTWLRVFTAYAQDSNLGAEEATDLSLLEESKSGVKYMSIDDKQGLIYVASGKEIYSSKDSGESWLAMPNYGLLGSEINFLLVDDSSTLYSVTNSGIFKYSCGRWYELSANLGAREFKFIALDKLSNLYAACDKGVFRAKSVGQEFGREQCLFISNSNAEPEVRQVQEAAVKYAEVDPQKINRWRKQAGKKAFLPKITAGVNRDSSDLWHWETGSTTKVGDDLLVKGRDSIGWDVSLTWDLGEIIWSSAQTDIDARSRLTSQLRDDILNEVTKLYFERLRMKLELNSVTLGDKIKLAERELRIKELTAMIDGLTGGYFSKNIKDSESGL